MAEVEDEVLGKAVYRWTIVDAMAGYTATEDVGVIDALVMDAVVANTLREDMMTG